ncbi:hypothetical protein C8P68_11245 [Mucilaginibacter yixingensis]|uniref:Uncharacterized protein n=1 Tax=Mucilaginibacter yixingensis TaxID=1295612 RepID=A0A2T5J4K9_9SPHI|nr:hypothetical protein [Mucilaginibacter yixingensis]PTQ92445.1 hypothetical protein C8P68_11245 [Mucilaginibacter yixingensis]
MKNKALNYLLITLVAVVWGTILYRVMAATKNDDDEGAVMRQAQMAKTPYDDYSERTDTTRLQLNYPDPFGSTPVAHKDTAVLSIHKSLPVSMAFNPKPMNNTVNWSAIKYAGFIRNAGSKKLIAILLVNGNNVSLQEGESAGNVRLIKNLRDSVKLSYNGQTKFITIDRSAQ